MLTEKRTFVMGASIALLSIAAASHGQSDIAKPAVQQSSMDIANKKFKAFDRNRDQRISLEEARKDPELLKRFASADANGDGQLDQAEFASKPSEKPAE